MGGVPQRGVVGRCHGRDGPACGTGASRGKLIEALRWHHRWGNQLEAWLKQHESGREPPHQFYERPEIPNHLRTYWDAFDDLSTERQNGMGIGYIPHSKIKQYVSDDMGLCGEAHGFAVDLLREVDRRYVAMVSEAINKKPNEVNPQDTEGVRDLLRRKAKRVNPEKARKAPDGS